MTPSDHDLRLHPAHTKRLALRGLLACLLVGSALSAHAVYVNGSTPPGFTGSPGAWAYKPASAEKWLAKTVATSTTVNVGGRAVTMNALLRMTPAATSTLARFAFNPYVAGATVALSALPYAIQWAESAGYSWSEPDKRWTKTESRSTVVWQWESNTYGQSKPSAAESCADKYRGGSDGTYMHSVATAGPVTVSSDGRTASAFCVGTATHWSGSPVLQETVGSTTGRAYCLNGAEMPVQGCPSESVTTTPTEQEFVNDVKTLPMPQQLPDLYPNPLPVELPIINPSDEPEPKARPLRVPIGDPIADPKPASEGEPQVWRQPVVDIVPSPTVQNPWRVDAQPKDIVTESPQGEPAPDPITEDTPVDTGEDTKSENKQETPGLCDMYPDILACAKPELDTPDDEIPKTERDVSFMTENLFGGGSCPANPSWTDKLGSHELNLGPFCDITINVIRPILLAMAALAALFIILPFRSET